MQTPAFASTKTLPTVEIIASIDLGCCGNGDVFVSGVRLWANEFELERRNGELE